MPEVREVMCWEDDFCRAVTFSTTPEGGTGWTIADVSSAGTPTYLAIDSNNGEVAMTLAATSEVENVCLFHNDVLSFNINELATVEFILKVANISATSTLVFGVASARNNTPDSVATHAWFRMEGSASTSAVVVETDDGTSDLDDKATGQTLSSTLKRFLIDFTNGVDDVRFYMEDASGHMTRVAATTTFDMGAVASTQKVQPIVQVQKTASTSTPAVTIDKVKIVKRKVA